MEFEKIIEKNPKKNQFWNLYLDMEIKNTKNINKIWEIFDRVCSLPHKTKIAKGFFKKYFNFETVYGD